MSRSVRNPAIPTTPGAVHPDLVPLFPPTPGKRWRHIGIGTHNSWIPADERGFRSRGHRVHSSGDYRDPPPRDEHAGLRHATRAQSGAAIEIPPAARPLIGQALIDNLITHNYRVAAAAVSKFHAHVAVELPDDPRSIRTVVGWAKQKSSRAVTHLLPVQIWGEGEGYEPIDELRHLENVIQYLTYKQGPWTWTWSYLEGFYWRSTYPGAQRPA